jgi:hypothetical protein
VEYSDYKTNALLGHFRELLIPDRPNVFSNVSRKEWHKDIKYCVQHRYVYCHECREWVKKAKYKYRSIQGVVCHWNEKCTQCQTIGYNKRIDRGLCHVIFNGQVVIPNQAIRSPTSSPIPFDMDYSVVPELDIPKHIEEVTSEGIEHQQYRSSHTDESKLIRNYGYGTPATHNLEDWIHLVWTPRWCYPCNGLDIKPKCRELHPYSFTLEESPQPVGTNFVDMTTTVTSTYIDENTWSVLSELESIDGDDPTQIVK